MYISIDMMKKMISNIPTPIFLHNNWEYLEFLQVYYEALILPCIKLFNCNFTRTKLRLHMCCFGSIVNPLHGHVEC
jgi:hypothetical protein